MINTSVPKGRKDAIRSITSLCRIKTPAPAFSLMEMMVIMLVIAVVMAISAPMITKKTGGSGGGGASVLTSIAGGNVAYNLSGAPRTVILGGKDADIAQMAQYASGVAYLPRLILQSERDYPQLGFMYGGSATGTMLVGSSNRIAIGNKAEVSSEGKNSVVIGQGIKGQSNSVLIGGMFPEEEGATEEDKRTMDAASAVAIGYNVNAGSSAVTIGTNASTNIDPDSEDDPGLVAIGASAEAITNSVAIGYRAKSSGNGVAIGSQANSTGGIAIGYYSSAMGEGMAIGYGVSSSSCDAIGASCSGSGSMTIGGRSNILINASNIFSSVSSSASFSADNTLSLNGGTKPVDMSSLTVANDITANTITGGSLSARKGKVEDGENYATAKAGYFNNIQSRYNSDMAILQGYLNGLNTAVDELYRDRTTRHDDYPTEYTYTDINNCSCSDDVFDNETNSGLAKFAFWKKDSCCNSSPRFAYNYTSDERLKDIIGENLDAMDKINRLKVYDFTFKDDESKTKHVGVVAQELQEVFPNAVVEGEDGYLHIRHEDIFYAMVRGLQELDVKVKKLAEGVSEHIKLIAANKIAVAELEAKIKAQDKETAELKKEIASLKKIVKKLSK